MGLIFESAWQPSSFPTYFEVEGVPVISQSTTDLYTHQDWTSDIAEDIGLSGDYASDLQTYLQFAVSGTMTATYNASTRAYTIADSSAFALNFIIGGTKGQMARLILGFSEPYYSGANSYTSDATPVFTIEAPFDCRYNTKPDYETGDQLSGGSQNGIVWSNAPSSIRKRFDFRVEHIPRASVFKHLETAQSPWSWESFVNYHRGGEYFVCDAQASEGVVTAHRLRGDSYAFAPKEISPGYVGAYHLDFGSYVYR